MKIRPAYYFYLILLILFTYCKKKPDAALLEKIEKEGRGAYIKGSYVESVFSEPKKDSKVIGEIFFDSEIKGIEEENKDKEKWFLFILNGEIGWIPFDKLSSSLNSHKYFTVIADTVNVYSEQDEKSKVLGKLNSLETGKYFTLSRYIPEWLPIQYNGKKAFLKYANQDFSFYNGGFAFVYNDSADLKDFPSDSAKTITKIPYGESVKILKESQVENETTIKLSEADYFISREDNFRWFLVSFKEKKGYVNEKDLGDKMFFYIATETVNVFEKPDPQSKSLGTIKKDESLTSYEKTNPNISNGEIRDNWIRIEFKNKLGWVQGSSLLDQKTFEERKIYKAQFDNERPDNL